MIYALLRFATLCYALHICEVQSPLHTVSVNVMKGSAPSTKLWKMWWKGSGTTAHCFWQIIWNASFRMFQNVSEHCENCFKCQTVLKHLETIPDSRMTLFCLNGLFALESVWILSPFICTVPASVETRGGHAGYELRSLKSTQRRRRNFDPSVAECFTVFFFKRYFIILPGHCWALISIGISGS